LYDFKLQSKVRLLAREHILALSRVGTMRRLVAGESI
jgi:hypothetical protein